MVMTIAEFEKVGNEAEKALIAACRAGEKCVLGATVPEENAANLPTIRAALIRALALEKTSLHETGVWLAGAVIVGELNLSFARCRGMLVLQDCRFEEPPQMGHAELAQLSFDRSHLPGLFAQGVRVTGGLFLRDVTAAGTVDVNAAQISGQFACEKAKLNGMGGKALSAQSMRVTEGFYFRDVKEVKGQIDLTSARIGDLADDAASWLKCDDTLLDGFAYDRIGGPKAPKTFADRRAWLEKGAWFKGVFHPQPYTQFARVMLAAGHAAEARKALMARDTILFEVAEAADRAALDDARNGGAETKGDSGEIWARLQARRVWAALSRNIIGHGHKPQFALFWALGLWLVGTVVYFFAYKAGLMVPNSDVILVSQEWLRAVEETRLSPTGVWTGEGALASVHYESFFAAIYALDLFLPIVDLGQEGAWAVTTPTDFGLGWWLRVVTFLYQVMGWLVTSLGIAAVTGFVQRDKPE